MSLACETETRVQNECALRLSVMSKPVPILEYIRAISSYIGASHILAVFEENETLKVFFDDKRYVDILIKTGIHVTGHHVRIDYVVPPGIKIILSDVDPVITNYDIIRILSPYGAIVSPIIRPPISDDTELCHIGYGVRYVYMVLSGGDIPSKINFKCGDQHYTVKARIEERPGLFMIPYIKSDSDVNCDEMNLNSESLPGPSGIAINAIESPDPIVVHVESSAAESNTSLAIVSTQSSKSVVSFKRRAGRPRKNLIINRKRITATSQAARRIRKTVKQKYITKLKQYKRGKRGRKPDIKIRANAVDPPLLITSDNEETNNIMFTNECILNKQNFCMFLNEVKHQRAPLELAKKYIGENCDSNALNKLIEQLNEYKASQNNINLKNRVWRLVKSLKESMEASLIV